MLYKDKELADYDLWELGAIEKFLNDAMAAREEAAKHAKFEKMEFPPPNPKFLELKNAVELEIKNKQEQNNA
jgi:hypothetical protein